MIPSAGIGTVSRSITVETITRLLQGESISLPPKESRESNLNWDEELVDWKDGARPETYAVIKPIKTATSRAWPRPEGNRLTADGVGLPILVQLAYDVDRRHLDNRVLDNGVSYRAAFRVPRNVRSSYAH